MLYKTYVLASKNSGTEVNRATL